MKNIGFHTVWNFLFFAITHLIILLTFAHTAQSESLDGAKYYQEEIQPMFELYCYMCHGNGMSEGGMSFDKFESVDDLLNSHEHWLKVLKNVRAGIMPPQPLLRPNHEEFEKIRHWIKTRVFDIDLQQPDPGHVTIRRLNRIEYQNTIRDLMGVEYETDGEFPPDDTGYGFDNIGDVLSLSPLLLEKYVKAAESIVQEAVPTKTKVMPEEWIQGWKFRNKDRSENGDRMTFYEERTVSYTFDAKHSGTYKLILELEVDGSFDFDPGECEVQFFVNGTERLKEKYAWQAGKDYVYELEEEWEAGEHTLEFALTPLVSKEKQRNKLDFEINWVRIEGPMDNEHWVHPENYERFFHRVEPPRDQQHWDQYAYEVLYHFAKKAYRRPPNSTHIDQLVTLANSVYRHENKTFEEGIAQAMVAMLASPRFLFRIEQPGSKPVGERYPYVDEYALATRLSYFLWSSMPDDELFALAENNKLRNNLDKQVSRMLKDDRAEEFLENFVGQWLEARDVEHVPIDARRVLGLSRREARERDVDFDRSLRRAMRQETEMMFEYIMREDRSLLELIDANYTFLNEELAEHYGIDGIEGNDFRHVELPVESHRGGVLTQGTILAVTSNPTRTSIVKRGLFVVENLLGSPPPPAPPNIPTLEEAEKQFTDREPTMREVIELHRKDPMCSSCHARFDPIGMAMENFNAMGMWRDKESGRPIDASGKLITGEEFKNIEELKDILIKNHRLSFYRCMAEKLLTYAIGRGLHYYDEHSVDKIVEKIDQNSGRFSALLMGVIHSAPFQKMRDRTAISARPAQENQEKEPDYESQS